jgi:hypothetical protein
VLFYLILSQVFLDPLGMLSGQLTPLQQTPWKPFLLLLPYPGFSV